MSAPHRTQPHPIPRTYTHTKLRPIKTFGEYAGFPKVTGQPGSCQSRPGDAQRALVPRTAGQSDGRTDGQVGQNWAGIYSQANLLSKLESAIAKACRAHIG